MLTLSVQRWSNLGVYQGVPRATLGDFKYVEYDTLFPFLDSRQGWAKMEMKWHGVHDLTSPIAAAKSLLEFNKESSKLRCKKSWEDGNNDVDRTGMILLRGTSHQETKTTGRRMSLLKKISYFLYNGRHRVFEYSKRGKLVILVVEEERQE